MNAALFSSETPEWETPQWLFDALNKRSSVRIGNWSKYVGLSKVYKDKA